MKPRRHAPGCEVGRNPFKTPKNAACPRCAELMGARPAPAPRHTCHYPGSDPALCAACKKG